jgi:hypothetical protein
VRHLQRFPLGTPYPTIVAQVAAMKQHPLLKSAPVVVDQTGVGRAVVDQMRRTPSMGWIVPITITAGQSVTPSEDHGYHVPKKELVTCLQLLLQEHRLAVASGLPDVDVLLRELQNFRVKITLAANETFGAWREGDHDDLVLAVALTCWHAGRRTPPTTWSAWTSARARTPAPRRGRPPGQAQGPGGLTRRQGY